MPGISGSAVIEVIVLSRVMRTSIRACAKVRPGSPATGVHKSRATPTNRRCPSPPSGQVTSMLVVRRTEPPGHGGAGLAVLRGAGDMVTVFIHFTLNALARGINPGYPVRGQSTDAKPNFPARCAPADQRDRVPNRLAGGTAGQDTSRLCEEVFGGCHG
jgi:hypothetical protein